MHPAGLPLLPGEVEDVSTHIPSGIPSAADILPAAQPLTPAVNPRPMVEGAAAQKDEVLHGGLDQSGNRSGFVTCPFRDMLLCLSLSYFSQIWENSKFKLLIWALLTAIYRYCIYFFLNTESDRVFTWKLVFFRICFY